MSSSAAAGCDRTCLCTVLDKHSLVGFLTVLPLCDRDGYCPTLRAIHRREDAFLRESSRKRTRKKKKRHRNINNKNDKNDENDAKNDQNHDQNHDENDDKNDATGATGASDASDNDNTGTSSSSLITPHLCPRFVMLAAVVLVNFFIFSFWSYVLVARGNYSTVRDGGDNDHVASLKGRFGGRDFGEVSDCYQDNDAHLTFSVVSQAEAKTLAQNSRCTLDVLNDYYAECQVPANAQRINPQQCKAVQCKAAINNLFSCLVLSKNTFTELYTALTQCGEDWASDDGGGGKAESNTKASNRESGGAATPTATGRNGNNNKNNKNNNNATGPATGTNLLPRARVGVPLSREQGQAIVKLSACIKADCRAQRNEMLIQMVTTVVLTSLLTLVLEKIVNAAYGFGGQGNSGSGRCCGAACSHQSFCVGSGVLLVAVLAGTLVGAFLAARSALVKLKESAPQRCIYATPASMVGMLVQSFLPVLGMGWGTQVLTLLVTEWWAHRKIALAKEEAEGGGGGGGGGAEMVRL